MTTSEPRTPHDDTPREHRRLGQRILDAVLGDPADTRPDDPADPRRGDPDRAEGRTGAEGFAGDGPRGDMPTSGSCATRRRRARPGTTNRDDALRDAGHHAGGAVSDAHRDAGQAGYVDRNDAVRDAGYDPRHDAGQAGDADRNDAAFDDRGAAGRADTTAAPLGYDQPGSRAETAPGAAHDLPRSGAGTAGDDRDLVTSSYDPDRDTGYDPHAAGTAMGSAAGAGAAGVADRDARGGTDYDAAGDTGYVDDPRRERDS